MLTIFAIPKPFVGHIGVIQRNAISSWLGLDPRPEIILLGRENGVEEVVREHSLGWIPDIETTPYGTPLLGDGFRKVCARARFPLLAYVNCDIMFGQDLIDTLASISCPKFLAVGRRTNIELTTAVSADDLLDSSFLPRLAAAGSLETPFAIDYFLFPACPELCNIPQFAVGRPGWDNWMLYNALAHHMPLIETTAAIRALHQNHHYHHVPMQRGAAWEGPEADVNRTLAGSPDRLQFSLLDATHHVTLQGTVTANPTSSARSIRLLIAGHSMLKWPLKILGFPILFTDRRKRRRAKKSGYK
ncbi:MAG: hypothetical protein WCP35_10840 [Verrucomicrobiota bacterium]